MKGLKGKCGVQMASDEGIEGEMVSG